MKIGLDVGSTTIKCVVLDENEQICFESYERHYSQITEKMAALLTKIKNEVVKKQPVQLAEERSNYTEIEIDLIASYRLLNKENQNRMLAYTRNLLSNQQMEDEVKFSPRYSGFSSSSVDFEEKEIEHHENTEDRIG